MPGTVSLASATFGRTVERVSDSTEIGFSWPLLTNGRAAGSVLIT